MDTNPIIYNDISLVMTEQRTVVNGLEGCQKSSKVFELMDSKATIERPVIFAFKNYALMREQIETWSSRYNIPIEEFAICGFNKGYEEAQKSYTNKEFPHLIGPNVRFILITQKLLQRERWESLKRGCLNVSPCHIVVDEFDFTIGLIPTLSYCFENIGFNNIKIELTKKLEDHIYENYTADDVVNIKNAFKTNDKGFTIAHWISSCQCPITFLTSEIMAMSMLSLMGFKAIVYGKKEYLECTVNVCANYSVNRNFFDVMNKEVAWNRLKDYEVIVSDNISIKDVYDNKVIVPKLEMITVNHTSVRGSNGYMGKRLLTVVSHIPKQAIKQIMDAYNYLYVMKNGINETPIDYNTVEALFYRDRLCQAIGRVIGYRGGKSTDILIHYDIWDKIKNLHMIMDDYIKAITTRNRNEDIKLLPHFEASELNDIINSILFIGIKTMPYSINDKWHLRFDSDCEIWGKIKELDENRYGALIEQRERNYEYKISQINEKITSLFKAGDKDEYVEYYRIKKIIEDNHIRSILGHGYLQPAKVAKYFGVKTKVMSIGGRPVRVVMGIQLTKAS